MKNGMLIRRILRATKDESNTPYLFRLFSSTCDFYGCGVAAAKWTVWADGRPYTQCCTLHLGRALTWTASQRPGAGLEVRPYEQHQQVHLSSDHAPRRRD